jgi:hypothetical protein
MTGLIIRILALIIPKKLFKNLVSDHRTYMLNPLKSQSLLYLKCGCGSNQKINFCCGKNKYVTVHEYKQLIHALDIWKGN